MSFVTPLTNVSMIRPGPECSVQGICGERQPLFMGAVAGHLRGVLEPHLEKRTRRHDHAPR